MNWQDYIHSDSQVSLGKPTVKGTRISVEFLLGLFAVGWTEEQILENYPTLTSQALRAVFAFTAFLVPRLWLGMRIRRLCLLL